MSKKQLQLEQSQIINLAVNIFQNVGIKRYIGQIEALRHEDIYFQIYKIIFPDSMINIFKISESSLSTGEKIQKIIQQISSIIKLDLYHISGQAIAQGNRSHLTNWLQLLEALSNNCIAYQSYNGGGSAPDRDREMYREFQEDDYYTVQGVEGEFEKHVYTDENQKEREDDEEEDQGDEGQDEGRRSDIGAVREKEHYGYNQHHGHGHNQHHMQHQHQHQHHNHNHNHKEQEQPSMSKDEDQLDRSFRKSQSSNNQNVLKPIQDKKKPNRNQKQKKVTFKIDQGSQKINKNRTKPYQTFSKNNNLQKITATTLQDFSLTSKKSKQKFSSSPSYPYPSQSASQSQSQLLLKKKSFLSKMHGIQQQILRKQINDQLTKFQSWAFSSNSTSVSLLSQIEQENQLRTALINQKISEREQYIQSLSGREEALQEMKMIFKKQRQNQKKMRQIMQRAEKRQAIGVMDLGFAAEVERRIMRGIGE